MTDAENLNQPSLDIKLEENAMDSLVHGIEHHLYGRRRTDWKYVILHVFHAVELFLKARLAKHDEKLIYTNRKNGHTVTCDEAINRLVQEVKIPLFDYTELQNSGKYKGQYRLGGELNDLREARNAIEHKAVALSQDQVEDFLGVAFRFLDDFVRRELGISLKGKLDAFDEAYSEERFDDEAETEAEQNSYQTLSIEECFEGETELDQSTYKTLSMAYLSYIKRMQDRRIPISDPKEKDIDYNYFVCEMCDEEAIAVPDLTSKHPRLAHCFNCFAEYTTHYCIKCGEPYVSFLKEWEEHDDTFKYPEWVNYIDADVDSFCELCSEWIDDQ